MDRKKTKWKFSNITWCLKAPDLSNTMKIDISPSMGIANFFQDIVLNERSNFVLEFNSINKPNKNMKITWSKDGKEIKPSQRKKISSDGKNNKLSVFSVTPKDQGIYVIFFKQGSLSYMSKAVLYVIPTHTQFPNDAIYITAHPREKLGMRVQLTSSKVSIGNTIKLNAKLKDIKVNEFQWYKNFNRFIPDDVRKILLSDDSSTSLTVINAKKSDSGIYYVVGKTRFGVESSLTDVIVVDMLPSETKGSDLFPNNIDDAMNIVEAYEGEEVQILNKTYIDNNTEFKWLKDGSIFKLRPDVEVNIYNSRYVALNFRKVSMEDSGTYHLAVVNTATGSADTIESKLRIKKLPLEMFTPVTIVEHINSAISYIGSPVVFKCTFKIEHSEFCCPIWNVGAYRLQRSNSRFYVFCRGTQFYLLIKEVEPDMAGLILCNICRAIPNKKPVLLCTSTANLTIIPHTIGKDIATGFNVKNETPGFYNSDTKEYIPIIHEYDANETGDEACGSSSQSSNLADQRFRKTNFPDTFLIHRRRLSNSTGCYVTDRMKFEVDSSPNIDPLRDTDNPTMVLHYCKLDEYIYCMEARTNSPKIFSVLTVEKIIHEEADISSGAISRPMATLFKWYNMFNLCYTVEMVDANDFTGTGKTTSSQFEFLGAPLDRDITFIVRLAKDTSDSLINLYIRPHSQVKQPPKSLFNIIPMESYGGLFHETGHILGRGSFGEVALVKSFGQDYYAAKKIKNELKDIKKKAIKQFEMLTVLQHPKLVKTYLAFSGKHHFTLIMDYLWGGNLLQRLLHEDNIAEVDVKVYVRQICEALRYIHAYNIVHMDVKLENVLCHSLNTRLVKLADFSRAMVEKEHTECGAWYETNNYVAPEVLNYEQLSTACDMWSFGILTYLLLSGLMPFNGPNSIAKSIAMGKINFNDPAFKNVSDPAKHFITRLLLPRARTRMTARSALVHKWLQEESSSSRSCGSSSLKTRENLRKYMKIHRHRWQRASNVIIAAYRFRLAAKKVPRIQQLNNEGYIDEACSSSSQDLL